MVGTLFRIKFELTFRFNKKDIWIGAYVEEIDIIYICPLPCCVFKIRWRLLKP